MFSRKTKTQTRTYFDYAAATPVLPSVLRAMQPYWSDSYGNPGALHALGEDAKEAVSAARKRCADCIGAREGSIVFTGSGTESNNLAIFGSIEALIDAGRAPKDLHVVTSAIEHPSVLECAHALERRGVAVTYLPVSQEGIVEPSSIASALREETVLVSIMYVNNEVGVIEPIAEIGKVIRQHRKERKSAYPYFHTDASQAGLYLPINVDDLSVDLLTLDAQKMYGPKGVGLLYVRPGVELHPIAFGGSQEFGLRPGTENVPLIVGFGEAFTQAVRAREKEAKRLSTIRDFCIDEILRAIPKARINGPYGNGLERRIANNVNISLPGIDGEFLVIALDTAGFACGTRSACMREGGPSYVLAAMGKHDEAESSLRLSFGSATTKQDVARFVKALAGIVGKFDNLHK